MRVTYEFDVDSEDERAWWPVKGSDGLLWALPKPSAFGSGVKVTVHRGYDEPHVEGCPDCGRDTVVVDGVEAGYTLARCSSSFCGWTS